MGLIFSTFGNKALQNETKINVQGKDLSKLKSLKNKEVFDRHFNKVDLNYWEKAQVKHIINEEINKQEKALKKKHR